MAIRTFLALDLTAEVRNQIVSTRKRLGQLPGKIKWTEPENMHVTLNFLGDVEEAATATVCSIAQKCAAETPPFAFHVRGLVAAPPRGPLRMIWADVIDPTGNMEKLHDMLNQAFADSGFRSESRGFRGHLTVARIKATQDAHAIRQQLTPLGNLDFGTVHCDELVVYSSQLLKEGPIYTPMAHAPLG